MLGRLISPRIKAAQRAYAAGRLDEAYRLASAADLAEHSRVQKLLMSIAEGLFERAEQQFQSGRYAESLEDLVKAERAGVDAGRVGDLRTLVMGAAGEQAHQQHSRQERIADAQQRMASGSLEAARQILAQASQRDVEAAKLCDQVDLRANRVRRLLDEIEHHIGQACWSAAIDRYRAAAKENPTEPQLAGIEKLLVEQIVTLTRDALIEGRLSLATEEFARLRGLGDSQPAKLELKAVLDGVNRAAGSLAAGRYDDARKELLAQQRLLPGADWLVACCKQLHDVDEMLMQLQGGPLGSVRPVAQPARLELASGSMDETLPMGVGQSLPTRLLVLIDGAGSFLLLRSPRVTIGRAASKHPADVPLISDLSEHHAEIIRMEDDYFLKAKRDVNVAGRNAREALLHDGDRIILGKRSKFVFQLPSRKSASAVLDLGGTAKIPHDVRRVILFDRLATMGRSLSSHMVVPTAGEPLVLFERDGSLWLQHQQAGKREAAIEIQLETPVEMAGVRLVVEPYKAKPDGFHV